MSTRRSEASVGEPQGPPAPRPDTHDLAFRDPPPAFQLPIASAQDYRPLLFVHVDAASEKQKAKPRAHTVRRDVRSHVRFHAHENKRRSAIKKAERHLQTAVSVARMNEQTIWSIGMGNIDPFDTMPVKETPVYRNIVEYYFFDLPIQIPYSDGNVSPELRRRSPPPWAKSFWRLAKFEPVTFLASIWYTAVVYSIMRGKEVNAEFISWEKQARDLITKRPTSGSSISDSFVAAVCCLAMCATNQGLHEVSDTHYSGLINNVNARGGLDAFEPFTQSVVIWSEFCFRMRHMTIPVLYKELSPGGLQQWRETFPLELQRQARLRHQRGQLRLPLTGPDLDAILLNLHHLSIAQDPDWAGQTARTALRHILYDSEYKLLLILTDFKVDLERGVHESTLTAAQRVRSAVAQTAQLFLLAALSEMPFRRTLYNFLVERLKTTLSTSNLIDQWVQVAHLHSLIWVFFVGWALAAKGVNARLPQEWFEERLKGIMWQLDLRCEDLEKVLSQFPLTEAFWREHWQQLHCGSAS